MDDEYSLRDPVNLGAEIYRLIDQAHKSDDPAELVKLHKDAFHKSKKLPKYHELRGACALNLGAALIENQEHDKGLEYLEMAKELYSPDAQSHKGDLHFNTAIAKYRLGEFEDSFILIIQALIDYYNNKEGDHTAGDMKRECWQIMRQIILDASTSATGKQHKTVSFREHLTKLGSKSIGPRDEERKIKDGKEKCNGMAQCCLNMAHAYSRLDDAKSEKACELSFTTALGKAEENEDKHLMWQACEGLGAVYYNQGKYQKSVESYREANQYVFDAENSRRISSKLEMAILKLKDVQDEKSPEPQTSTNSSFRRTVSRKSKKQDIKKSKTSLT